MSHLNFNKFDFNSSKINSEKTISFIISKKKNSGETIGLCVGSYDLLHPGHMKHFESAKELCDILVVAVTTDNFVRKRKGINRPIISEKLRAYSIAQLEVVDYVLISPYERAEPLIRSVRPTYYIKGSDYINKKTPGIIAERKAIFEVKGEMKYTFDEKFSTTDLIRQIKKETDIPMLIISAGMAAAGKTMLLKKFAKKNGFMYINKDDIDNSFLSIIKEGEIIDKQSTRDSSFYNLNVKIQAYYAMFKIAERNLKNGFNVVLDGYYNDKLHISFIQKTLADISKNFHLVKIYFICSKKVLLNRMKKRNLKRDKAKLDRFEEYFNKHKDEDVSLYDIVFDTDGDPSVNVDSLSHEIMNIVNKR